MRQAGLVNEFGAESVVDIGDGDDAGGQRDGLAGQAVGIAGAVVAFVVVADKLRGHLQKFRGSPMLPGHGQQDIAADDGVRFHHRAFFRFQLAGLEKDVIWNRDLADVVKQNAALQHADKHVVNPALERWQAGCLLGEGAHIGLHAQQVAAGFQSAQLRHFGHGKDENFLSLVQVGVTKPLRQLQLLAERQGLGGLAIGTIFGLLDAQHGTHAIRQFLGQYTFGHAVVRSHRLRRGEPWRRVLRRDQNQFGVRSRRMHAPSPPLCSGTAAPSGGSACACSAISTTPRTRSRRRSSCSPGGPGRSAGRRGWPRGSSASPAAPH